ncbi:MAG: hypothetical protein QOD81_2175 [Solirubrobacteraceae bacterium]|jgi:hypothetical protein|nr:hypothetical protein [Solirubrobacteraceae bacterium]
MQRALLAVAAAIATVLVLVPAASGQAPGTQTLTFKEVDKGGTFRFIDNPPKSAQRRGQPTRVSAGDVFVFTSPLRTDAGAPFGRLRATCFVTANSRISRLAADCLGVYSLPNGQLWVSASTSFSGTTTTGAVLGGTGAYVNLHGSFASKSTKTGADTTVTLVGG